MPTNFYDLIVLGDEFAGLVAATLCARRGMRVLLARTGDRPARYQVGPYTLPVEPLPLAGIASPAARRVLEELHFQHQIKRRLREATPSFQLAGPDLRVDDTADELGLARELERELGPETSSAELCERASAIARLFDPLFAQDIAVPPTGFWERREVARVAGRLADEGAAWQEQVDGDPRLRALTTLPALLGSRCAADSLTPEARIRCFDMWRQGAPRIAGDWETVRELFLDKFKAQSGEVRTVKVDELLVGWGRVTGVRLDDGEELGAQHFIAALPVGELSSMFGRKQPKRLRQLADSIQPEAYRYTLNLVVAEAGIPEGMGDSVLAVADPDAPATGANALAIYVGAADDAARVVVTVQATCHDPGDDVSIDDAFAALRADIRAKLENVMPFISEHVLLAHSPNEAVPAEGLEGDLELGRPVPAPAIWSGPGEPSLGIATLPYNVGVKHLTMASTQVLPGLGVEGELIAGWCAAKLACAATGKKRDYLRTEVLADAR